MDGEGKGIRAACFLSVPKGDGDGGGGGGADRRGRCGGREEVNMAADSRPQEAPPATRVRHLSIY